MTKQEKTLLEKYEAIRNEKITIDVIIPIMACFHDELLNLPDKNGKMDDTMVRVINELYDSLFYIKLRNSMGDIYEHINADFFERVDNHDRTDI